jgi:hypothetical protein
MSEPEIRARFGVQLPPDDEDADSRHCREVEFTPAGAGVSVMLEEGRVTRVTAWRESRLRTADGLGIGSTQAVVQRRYGARLKTEPNHYDDAERYLTVWDSRLRRGIRFQTDSTGLVYAMHVGAESIYYVEGCS